MARHHLQGRKKPHLSRVRSKLRKEKLNHTKKTRKKRELEKLQAEVKRAAKLSQAQQYTFFRATEAILCVGEGNFSFAAALAEKMNALRRNPEAGGGVIATCLDDKSTLREKYTDGKVNVKRIEAAAGAVLYGVDATCLHEREEFAHAFDKIVFQFPHLGSGEKSVERSVHQHQHLLRSFFESARRCLKRLKTSEIHVTLKEGEPYKSWQVVSMASSGNNEIQCRTVLPFVPSDWPGYEHRRTQGFDERSSKKVRLSVADAQRSVPGQLRDRQRGEDIHICV